MTASTRLKTGKCMVLSQGGALGALLQLLSLIVDVRCIVKGFFVVFCHVSRRLCVCEYASRIPFCLLLSWEGRHFERYFYSLGTICGEIGLKTLGLLMHILCQLCVMGNFAYFAMISHNKLE